MDETANKPKTPLTPPPGWKPRNRKQRAEEQVRGRMTSIGEVLAQLQPRLERARETAQRVAQQRIANGEAPSKSDLRHSEREECPLCRGSQQLRKPRIDSEGNEVPGETKIVLCPRCGWERLFDIAHVPDRYLLPGVRPPEMVPFDAERLLDTKPLELALAYCANLDREVRDGMGLLFYGMNGSGKSHLAALVAVSAIREGKSVRFTTFEDALREVMNSFGVKDRDILDPMLKYERADVLVLDDLGSKENMTPFAIDRLFSLVNTRLNTKKPLVITTNVDPDLLGEVLAPGNPDQQRRLHERIVSVTYDAEVRSARSYRQIEKQDRMRRLLGGR